METYLMAHLDPYVTHTWPKMRLPDPALGHRRKRLILEEVSGRHSVISLQPGHSVIQLKDVYRTFGKHATGCIALRAISLAIPRGHLLAIVGPSGSGKTSLLNIIGGIDKPSHGSVRIEDRDLMTIGEARLSDLRLRRIGFVFQDPKLIPVLTVSENVEFPLLFRSEIPSAERRRRVSEVLKSVGLGDKVQRMPETLSGGERQRAALARALAGDPAFVLADEPTANLDQDNGIAILDLMRSLNRERGVTIIYSTHDPQLMAYADHVLKLRDGQIEEGPA
jgi:putative ABC transport system ATP-binding protein